MSKQIPELKILFVFLFSVVLTGNITGQTLLTENFNLAGGTLLTNAGWTSHSGAGTQPVDVTLPGLTFTGYSLSNIGGAAQIDNTGEDVNKTFPVQSAGKVYVAFMVKVIAAADGYFFHIGGDPISTIFRGKVFTVGTGDPFNFALSVQSNTGTNVAGGSYSLNKTYLFVLKYEIIDGEKNDAISMYIFSDAIPATEPATPAVGPLTDGTQTDIAPGSVALRQFSATQNYQIDGLRVAKTWAEAVTAGAGADTTPPVFSSGYPKTGNINSTVADLQVSMDEPGKAFYLVVPDGSASPTTDQVIAGTNYGTVSRIAGGSLDLTAGGSVKSVTLSGLTDKTNYDIWVVAQDNQAVPNKQAVPVLVNLYTTKPPATLLSAGFNSSLSPFTQVSITGAAIWDMYTTADIQCPKMSGYVNSAYQENTDYLISPAINLAQYSAAKLSFLSAKNFTGPALKVMISTNFNGTYTPAGVNAAAWTDITPNFTFSSGNYVFVPSGDYFFPAQTNQVYVAFVYESTATQAATWEIDDVLITGQSTVGSNIPEQPGIRLYPVPAHDRVTLDNIGKVTSIEIIALNGNVLLKEACYGAGRKSISVSHLTDGVYLVRMSMPGEQRVLRFIKE